MDEHFLNLVTDNKSWVQERQRMLSKMNTKIKQSKTKQNTTKYLGILYTNYRNQKITRKILKVAMVIKEHFTYRERWTTIIAEFPAGNMQMKSQQS